MTDPEDVSYHLLSDCPAEDDVPWIVLYHARFLSAIGKNFSEFVQIFLWKYPGAANPEGSAAEAVGKV